MAKSFYSLVASIFAQAFASSRAFAAAGDKIVFRDMSNQMVQAAGCFPNYVSMVCWLMGVSGIAVLLGAGAYSLRRKRFPQARLLPFAVAAVAPIVLLSILPAINAFHDSPGGLFMALLIAASGFPAWLSAWLCHKQMIKKPEEERTKLARRYFWGLAFFSVFILSFPFVQNALKGSIVDTTMTKAGSPEP